MDNQNPAQIPPANPTPPAENPVQNPPIQNEAADKSHVYVAPHVENPPPKKFSLSPKIMLIILALLIVVVIGSGIYLSTGSQPKPTPKTTPTIVSKPTPTPDPTTSWKTYNNESLGVSLKYPSDWFFEKGTIFSKDGMTDSDNFFKSKAEPQIFTFSAYKDSPTYGQTANDYLKYYQSLANNKSGASVIVSSKEKTIGENIKGIQIDYGGVDVGRLIVFDKDQKLFSFSLLVMTMDPKKVEENQKILDQILSTFKFTDNSQVLSQKDIEEIKIAVAQKDGQPLSSEHIAFDTTNDKYNGSYATGQVGPLNGGGGAKWFASKIENQWVVVWVGNGLPTCAEIAKYNLPEDFISCY